MVCLCAPACEKMDPGSEPGEETTPAVPIELTKADGSIRDASNAAGLDIFSRLYAVRNGSPFFTR